MADKRARERMVFETTEVLKRAIRVRAALDGVKPADVINAALAAYLTKEIGLAGEKLPQGKTGPEGGGSKQPRHKEGRI